MNAAPQPDPELPPEKSLKEKIADYIHSNNDDFLLELTVFRHCRGLQRPSNATLRECDHSGHYVDPATGKARQYDLRLEFVSQDQTTHLLMAVECKNVSPDAPIIVSRLNRQIPEMVSEVLIAGTRDFPQSGNTREIVEVELPNAYGAEHVGKNIVQLKPEEQSTNQRGKPKQPKPEQVQYPKLIKVTSDTEKIDSKWLQAVASAHTYLDSKTRSLVGGRVYFCAVPVLVVPDETLWCVDYDGNGTIQAGPEKVKECTLYLNQRADATGYAISHLEIFTLVTFLDHLRSFSSGEREWTRRYFPVFHPPSTK